jgi:putative Mg2+ transporter-C (MgtC) family protein
MNFLTDDFLILPDTAQLVRVIVRVLAAALLGGLVGAERQWVGKAAGLRTHMLVSLGAALFVIAPAEAGVDEGDLGRIVQGIAAGVGFIGAGTILKRARRGEIQGLTTAASIWLTAAIGVAVAVGRIWLPVVAVICAWLILFVLAAVEGRLSPAPSETTTEKNERRGRSR